MLWSCLECSTRYALDLRACPHCGSTHREEGDMPKITFYGGPSDARDLKAPVEDVVPDESVEAVDAQTRPSPADRKDLWVSYAVESGGDPHVIASMTKAALIKEYGA